MKRIKYILCVLRGAVFIAAISFGISSAYALKINKVKIIGNKHTSKETILAFADEIINSNNEYTEEDLKKLAKRIQARLKRTTWFYGAKVYIVQTKKGETYRNIIIEVSEGFLRRFGGGSLYGKYGRVNIFGGGGFIISELGLNRQMVYIGDDIVWQKYHYSFSGGNLNLTRNILENNKYVEKKFQNITAGAKVGYKINYDLKINAGLNYNKIFYDNYELYDNYYSYSVEAQYDKRGINFYKRENGFFSVLEYRLIEPYKISQYTVDFQKFFLLFENLNFSSRVLLKWYDNKNSPDYLKFSMANVNGVRSSSIEKLTGSAFAGLNFELRWDFFEYLIYPVFNTQYQSALFFDIGEARDSIKNIKGHQIVYAYGAAFRVFLESPIYVPIRLELSRDSENSNQFFYAFNLNF